MSNVQTEGKPYTEVEEAGTSETATYALPLTGRLDVESVVATIDNSAGGTIHPILYLAAPNGEIIAKKVQSDSIPAGDVGSATWALRLDDKSAGVAASAAAWAQVRRSTPQGTLSGADAFLAWDQFSTSDQAIFSTLPGGVAGDTILAFSTPGIYLLLSTFTWLAVLANTRSGIMVNAGVAPLAFLSASLANAFQVNNAAYTFASTHADAQLVALNSSSPQCQVRLRARQNSGLGQTIGAGAEMAAYYWPAGDGQVVY